MFTKKEKIVFVVLGVFSLMSSDNVESMRRVNPATVYEYDARCRLVDPAHPPERRYRVARLNWLETTDTVREATYPAEQPDYVAPVSTTTDNTTDDVLIPFPWSISYLLNHH
jgi:hypothetical protein